MSGDRGQSRLLAQGALLMPTGVPLLVSPGVEIPVSCYPVAATRWSAMFSRSACTSDRNASRVRTPSASSASAYWTA